MGKSSTATTAAAAIALLFLLLATGSSGQDLTTAMPIKDVVLQPVNENGPVITGPGGQLMAESAHPASVQDEGEEADPSNAVVGQEKAGPPVPLNGPMVSVPGTGTEVEKDDDVFEQNQAAAETTAPITKSDNTAMIIILVLVLVLLLAVVIGVIVYCVLRRKRKAAAARTVVVGNATGQEITSDAAVPVVATA